MSLVSVLELAFLALGRHRMRTGLTTLGIAIGVAAVISTVAIGDGSAEQLRRQLAEMGDDYVWIEAGGRNVGGVRTGSGALPTLNVGDMRAIEDAVRSVTACSPQVDSRIQIVYRNQNWNTTYRGVSPEYLAVRHWALQSGVNFSDADIEGRANVCILGKGVVDALFPDGQDPVGEVIRVRTLPFRVLGVLRPKGATSTGADQDDQILIPYTTAQRKIRNITWVDDIMCGVASPRAVLRTQADIVALLRDRHRLPPTAENDFNIRTPQETMRLRQESSQTLALMISAVASIALVIGGIGVMNIMLVSIAERTREIGLRLAVGARQRDVRSQFLIEAIVLSLVGGAAGIGLGVFGSQVLVRTLDWTLRISPRTIAVAIGCATATGVLFGYYPARRAAQMDPIDALRAE